MSLSSLSLAFVFGIVAAAPVGPVNMIAIRRGLVVNWLHALSVGAGSVAVEAVYVAGALLGNRFLKDNLPQDMISLVLGLPAAAIVATIGALILGKALRNPPRVLAGAGADAPSPKTVPPTYFRDAATGGVLTAINPGTLVYWILGAGPTWLNKADLPPGSPAVWLGVLAAVAGLAAWFTLIALLVRLRPDRVGPNFFRWVNILCGAALIATGIGLGFQSLTHKTPMH